MKTSTNHFVSIVAACKYYRPQGYSTADVGRKIKSKEIVIGKPEAKPGQTVGIIKGEGRYYIEDKK